MTDYKRIAIDTSKAVFTLHGIDQQERPVGKRQVASRPRVLRDGGRASGMLSRITCISPRSRMLSI